MSDVSREPSGPIAAWKAIRTDILYNGGDEIESPSPADKAAGIRPDIPATIIDIEASFIADRRWHLAETAPFLPPPPPGLTGLALSGGGIRSATFCLGVLQALALRGVHRRLDYLSSVSGGGYFGASLIATMIESQGAFVFGKELEKPAPAGRNNSPPANDLADTPAVGHLRNYSNYLIPNGAWDVFTATAVVLRGLVANAVLILWVPFLAAAFTVLFNPLRSDLNKPKILMFEIPGANPRYFFLTQFAVAAVILLYLLWAINRSIWPPAHTRSDATGAAPRNNAIFLLIAFTMAFLEFQPFAIEALFRANPFDPKPANWLFDLFARLSLLAPPLMALVTFFRGTLKTFLDNSATDNRFRALMGRFLVKVALWCAAAALPLLIWSFYLLLCYWAVNNDCADCAPTPPPLWIASLEQIFGNRWYLPYFAIAALLFLVSLLLAPNANSLHHLYRDRLARAFLFKPVQPGSQPAAHDERTLTSKDMPQTQLNDDPPQAALTMDQLASLDAPYLLINTAVNLEASREANRRGRNADFFLISSLFVGSRATGYVATKAYRQRGFNSHGLSLATAVAISGAAASSNMGSNTIRVLSPTLAMLNIRLGYWLTNPRFIVRRGRPSAGRRGHFAARWLRALRNSPHFYLFAEMFSVMSEDDKRVYLTDGGHIENLGLYELLRRRCKTIVAIDAEADSAMRFGSLITLQIYARIDLGVRIDLPIEALRATAQARQKAPDAPATAGPHIAIGRIDYGDGEWGTLIYVKAMLTGDENDYIRDYWRRYPSFPHESTGDQFFSEEQFEVYRALGFHAMHHFLNGEDAAIVSQHTGPVMARIDAAGNDLIDEARKLLRPSCGTGGAPTGSPTKTNAPTV